jgi:receptor protein-tyrosine kinase
VTTPQKPAHLVERAAEKLSAAADLSLAAPPARRLTEAPAVDAADPSGSNGRAKPATTIAGTPASPDTPAAVSESPRALVDIVDLETLSAAGLVVSGNMRTRISEEYRIAVSRILREARVKRPGLATGEMLMVTSAKPGEGKSFTALNLAGAIAHNVMRPTVLVDVDFKKKSITYQLGLSDRLGLLDVASTGKLQIEDLIVPTAVEHLSILPVGRDAGDVREGAARRPISQVIERLGRRFPDHIFILDLPPCLSTSDPSTLAPVVSEVIMVVEAERTQRNEVEAAIDLVKLCPKITLLLNKIQTTSSNTFGAYDYYGSYS